MQPVNFQMPGYKVNEYLLVLSPHEELSKKIISIRNEFAGNYKTAVTKFSKPHITLVHFLGLGMMEEKITHRLQTISMGVTPFKVELKDYGCYPSHSIFIQVTSKLPIQSLTRALREAQRLMKLNQEHKAHFIDEPHLIIGRKLKPWQYEQGWLEYRHREFTGRFIADNMLLLKRNAGENTKFQIARRFDFLNLPVTTRQGSFF